ncbi:hypothetical protein B0T18DRAFT_243618 [Schizothecium vesticola]|uniref:Uncharacterized protein n=1 Tax=Schizothecium vesticola TaxID=314040 RepID=A0AA40BQC8_9PEZI|nr:hypothetical protein B0T18DRAFT_243618 [Schizothecium vesticola]
MESRWSDAPPATRRAWRPEARHAVQPSECRADPPRTSRPPDPHRLLPAPVSVDEHYRAVSSEPLTTTNPDLLLAGVAGSNTGGKTATLPGFLFYVRSSSRNGINGAMTQCSHCGHISRDGRRPSAEERGRQQEAHRQLRQRPTSFHRFHSCPLAHASSCPARPGNRCALRNVRFCLVQPVATERAVERVSRPQIQFRACRPPCPCRQRC